MANEYPDFRIVYYDDLNGYYKMSPVSYITLNDAKKSVEEMQNKRTGRQNDMTWANIWGIVQVQHKLGED